MISSLIIGLYGFCLFILMLYGIHRYWILWLYFRHHKYRTSSNQLSLASLENAFPELPIVTIQLPLYNEMFVAERVISAVAAFRYPKNKLEIQVLDDSTDATTAVVSRCVEKFKASGFNITHLKRTDRSGYKAGALAAGLIHAKGEFVAIFDADFVPPIDFLEKTLPPFADASVGMVQTRWGHLNAEYSLLTRLQSIFLDGHFMLEHTARHRSGAFFNFNGTAGVWRRKAIDDGGGWSARTLTEDLDLSYRAQLKGWRFVYLPNVVCPAELPIDIQSFRSQQERWTQGAVQVARKMLRSIWRSSVPFHTKLESTLHLTASTGYFLSMLVSLLLLPSLIVRSHLGFDGINIIEVLAFLLMSVSIASFYVVSQREIYPQWKKTFQYLPALMAFGIAMALSNSRAVLRGVFHVGGEFVRTPKYSIVTNSPNKRSQRYFQGSWSLGWTYWIFTAYSALTLSVALETKHYIALPFILLFVGGFSYVSGLTLLHHFRRQ